MTQTWDRQMEALGSYIRTQRQLANLSLRQLADLASVSNPYLSQVERGLHQPSMRVLKSIADALNVSAETLLARAGMLPDEATKATASADSGSPVEKAIRADSALSKESKTMMLTLYKTLSKNRDAR